MRWLLCGPVSFVAATALMAALPVILPPGPAGIDNLVFPIVLFPGLWAAVFFYTCLECNLLRASAVVAFVTLAAGAVTGLSTVSLMASP